MSHIEFAEAESRALDPTAWDRWINRLEKTVGHSLDGDENADGYSLDFCLDLFRERVSVDDAASLIHSNKASLARW